MTCIRNGAYGIVEFRPLAILINALLLYRQLKGYIHLWYVLNQAVNHADCFCLTLVHTRCSPFSRSVLLWLTCPRLPEVPIIQIPAARLTDVLACRLTDGGYTYTQVGREGQPAEIRQHQVCSNIIDAAPNVR
jgi:hypothetical protein